MSRERKFTGLLFNIVPMKLIAAVLVLLFPLISRAQTPHVIMPAMDTNYFQMVVSYLAADSMKGRLPGTPEENKAAQFIAGEFQRAGCKPIKRKRFISPFDYLGPDSVMIHSSGNVIAKVNTKSDYCIVVTAHYDHIGYGKHHSNDPFSHAIHNGADDNASGIAVMLALAQWCTASQKTLQHDIIFVAVSGEEDGLFGSKEFLRSGLTDTSRIVCNINLDMVGHLDRLRPMIFLEGAFENPAWHKLLPPDTTKDYFVFKSAVRFKDGSDHCTFLLAKIPALLVTTGNSQHYHRPGDDAERVNYAGMEIVGEYLRSTIHQLNVKDLPSRFGRKRK